MVRGSGKFKTKRGGGRSFSRHMSLDENGIAVGTDPRKRKEESSDEDEDDDEDEDEDSEDEEDGSDEQAGGDTAGNGPPKSELTRTQRRELKRVSKGKQQQPKSGTAGKEDGGGEDDDNEEDDDTDLINPNHVKKRLNISDLSAPRELTRREREQKEKKEAQERYWKLHQQGKTDQAKMDLERLAKIRKEREQALAKRKAEQEEKAKEAEAKKAAQRSGKRA